MIHLVSVDAAKISVGYESRFVAEVKIVCTGQLTPDSLYERLSVPWGHPEICASCVSIAKTMNHVPHSMAGVRR